MFTERELYRDSESWRYAQPPVCRQTFDLIVLTEICLVVRTIDLEESDRDDTRKSRQEGRRHELN